LAQLDAISAALSGVPRHPLLEGPTRLQRLAGLERRLERTGLYVKRDDEMGIAVGGNKLRSLEFWLGEALARGARTLLVAGGPSSNQCRLTAAAASMAGLECIVFHNADSNPEAERASLLSRVYGARIEYIGPVDEQRRAEHVARAADVIRREGGKPYIVGDAAVGALGYLVAAGELAAQSRETGAGIRHVFLPGSMGPTEAGFILGNRLIGGPFEVHVVSVEYEERELAARIEKILQDAIALLGIAPPPAAAADVHIHMGELGPGYAVPTRASEAALLTLARSDGLLLEHVYTAKTAAGFLDCLARELVPKQAPAAFIHTGGVPSLFAQLDWFRTL
jgi:1-aminocyclopropane-1-carboxylate deaminase/D-cysteine desulfhydrase-like pyridoxal-dependent ACC family enzyme